MGERKALSSRHELFCQGIAKGLTATQAYAEAGFSANGAAQSASRLLSTAKIVSRIEQLKTAVVAKVVEQTGRDRGWVLEQLERNYDRAMQAEPILNSQGDETGEFRYDGAVANRALELIGKEVGMFVERLRVEDLDALTPDELKEVAAGRVPARALKLA